MTRNALHRIFCLFCLLGWFSSSAYAGGYQLWEQNVTNIENFHAGRAALANDASTSYDNPAGIIRIKNQQVVVGAMAILTDVEFNGTVSNCMTLPDDISCAPVSQGYAQGGTFGLIPDLHYVAPINPHLGFGLSVVAPYGSDVEWGQTSFVAQVITRARLQIIDITPALGFSITPKLSLGVGFDIEKMSAELNTILPTAPVVTKAFDTAYGYHAGALYQFSEGTRAGLAYHSKIIHHLKGTSNNIGIEWSRDSATVNLPPDTTFSIYHKLNPKWAVMGTVVYTQWNIVHDLVINGLAGIEGLPVDFPQNFRNTWTYSLGADFYTTDKLTLRAGGGYDQTPTRNAYRALQLPDSDRYDLAVGAHYQATKTLGLDFGWTRVFMQNAAINPPLHPELYPLMLQNTAVGKAKATADVIGAQLTWDIV